MRESTTEMVVLCVVVVLTAYWTWRLVETEAAVVLASGVASWATTIFFDLKYALKELERIRFLLSRREKDS